MPSHDTPASEVRGVCVLRDYRLYRLDGAGKIVGADWLSAADDDDAARQARDVQGQSTLEVWNRNRLVIRLEPNSGPPAP